MIKLILSMCACFLATSTTLAMEPAMPHRDTWLIAIRNNAENPLAMFKVLKALSIVNKKFKAELNDGAIARALLTYWNPSSSVGEDKSLLLFLIKNDQARFLATLLKEASNKRENFDWKSLSAIKQNFWVSLNEEVRTASRLIAAVKYNRLLCLEELLRHGAPILTIDNNTQENALSFAIKNSPSLLGLLLAELKMNAKELDNLNVPQTKNQLVVPLLSLLAEYGHNDAIDYLYKKGCSLETRTKNYDATPLLFATEAGKVDTIKKLIDLGADIHAETRLGKSAFEILIEKDHMPLAMMFLKLYTPTKLLAKITNRLENPISRAFKRNNFILAKLIIERLPSDIEPTFFDDLTIAIDPTGEQHLMAVAAAHGQIEIIEILHQKGCSMEKKNPRNGSTPIMFAAQHGETATVQRLAELGASINASNNDNWTPLYWAAYANRDETVEKLIELRANVNVKTDSQKTAFTCAFNKNNNAMMKELLLARADIKLEEDRQENILNYILDQKNDHELQALIKTLLPESEHYMESTHRH